MSWQITITGFDASVQGVMTVPSWAPHHVIPALLDALGWTPSVFQLRVLEDNRAVLTDMGTGEAFLLVGVEV